jgi:hypothetical protein
MFGPLHIHLNGTSLCRQITFLQISFDQVKGANPNLLCADCRRRYKNLTGIDLLKPEINKALLRAKTNTL